MPQSKIGAFRAQDRISVAVSGWISSALHIKWDQRLGVSLDTGMFIGRGSCSWIGFLV